MPQQDKLILVMPVYNEQESLPGLFQEWLPVLESLEIDYSFLVVDDGSKDQSFAFLQNFAAQNSKVHAYSRKNMGHGQSCLELYKKAIEAGADFIFQMDSDGQCDPQFFKSLWEKRSPSQAVFGFRKTRADGLFRYVASRAVSLVAWWSTGIFVKDANVPYRLMPTQPLAQTLGNIPQSFGLANIPVALDLENNSGILWVPIHFRDRTGGSPSVKPGSFLSQAIKLHRQLKTWSGA